MVVSIDNVNISIKTEGKDQFFPYFVICCYAAIVSLCQDVHTKNITEHNGS